MRRIFSLFAVACLVAATALVSSGKQDEKKNAKPDFDMTASYIEACSCDMFCPCYFNTHSTAHHGEKMEEHFCRANLVLKVDKGFYKNTKLDGAKIWIATDLGSDWSTGKDSWAVLNYDPSVTAEQRLALNDIIGQLYPFQWQKFDVDTQGFTWNVDEKAGIATAKMNNGKAEVVLKKEKGDDPGREIVMQNLKYWTAQSNDGFRMWKSDHEGFDGKGHKFSYSGTNGFLITIHFSGNAKAAASGN
ncbi:MAG TPA: DUF1326 domain-containing protein [Candidatus Acidoferrum sp.]|nr:DUF1326 domain-containing protein [Candidatus Acidoferrum sp.]